MDEKEKVGKEEGRKKRRKKRREIDTKKRERKEK